MLKQLSNMCMMSCITCLMNFSLKRWQYSNWGENSIEPWFSLVTVLTNVNADCGKVLICQEFDLSEVLLLVHLQLTLISLPLQGDQGPQGSPGSQGFAGPPVSPDTSLHFLCRILTESFNKNSWICPQTATSNLKVNIFHYFPIASCNFPWMYKWINRRFNE